MNAATIQAELLHDDPTRVRIALQAIRALDETGRAELAEGVTRALHELERTLTDAGDDDVPPTAYRTVFFPFVAATLRVRAAHGVIARLMVCPAQAGELWGDTITENGPYILADTFDGNQHALRGLFFDDKAYPYARAEALKALAVLMRRGELPREVVISLLAQLTDHVIANGKEPLDTAARNNLAYFATSILCEAADMGLSELTSCMARIPQERLWDACVDDAERVLRQLERGEAVPPANDESITDAWGMCGIGFGSMASRIGWSRSGMPGRVRCRRRPCRWLCPYGAKPPKSGAMTPAPAVAERNSRSVVGPKP